MRCTNLHCRCHGRIRTVSIPNLGDGVYALSAFVCGACGYALSVVHSPWPFLGGG